jgi:hypothetical protein
VQEYYFSYDYSFNPFASIQSPPQNPPDTTVREINGFLTQDSLIKRSKVVFVDSARSLVFLFGDTTMSVYSFSFETGVSKQPQTSARVNNNLSIIYRPSERRLSFTSSKPWCGSPVMVRLYSPNGKLLFAKDAGRERSVRVPEGICGVVIVKVISGNEKVEKKILLIK